MALTFDTGIFSGTVSGWTEFRLEIEGMPTQWVTHPGLVTGSFRKDGLQKDGLILNETILYDKGISENQDGITFQIVDFAGNATTEFCSLPTLEIITAAELTTLATTMSVVTGSAVSFTTGSVYWLGIEAVQIVSSSNLPDQLYLSRSYYGSHAIHYYLPSPAIGPTQYSPTITDKPFGIKGRRCILYGYAEGDSVNSAGTVVYRGIITTDIRFADESDTTYSFSTDNIITILNGNLGTNFSNIVPRGFYFPDSEPLVFRIAETNSSNWDDTSYANGPINISISGIFTGSITGISPLADVAEMINRAVTGSTSSWNHKWNFERLNSRAAGKDTYGFTVQIRASNRAPYVQTMNGLRIAGSHGYGSVGPESIQGWMNYTPQSGPPHIYCITDNDPIGLFYDSVTGSGANVTNNPNQIGKKLYIRTIDDTDVWPDSAQKVYCGRIPGGFTSSFPANVLYLDFRNQPLVSNFASLTITKNDDSYPLPHDSPFTNIQIIPGSLDSTNGTIRYSALSDPHGENDSFIMRVGGSKPTSHLISFNTFISGSIYDFLNGLTSNDFYSGGSSEMVNLGYSPLLTIDDFDLQDIQDTLASLDSTSYADYQQRRIFSFFNGGEKLFDILGNEALFNGCYFCIGRNGKITLRRLRFAASSEIPRVTINSTNLLSDKRQPGYERSSEGQWNVITLLDKKDSSGYQLNESIQWNQALSRMNGVRKELKIELRSQPQIVPTIAGPPTSATFINDILWQPLRFLGSSYAIITIETQNIYSLNVGDVVSLTNQNLPNSLGTRGLSGITAIVKSRNLDLKTGFAEYKLIYFEQGLKGWCPSLAPTIAVDNGGDNWDITFTQNLFGAAGNNDIDFFTTGDIIELDIFDNDNISSTKTKGFIKTITGTNTINVTFDITAPADFATNPTGYRILFADKPASQLQTDQLIYAYISSGSNERNSRYGA